MSDVALRTAGLGKMYHIGGERQAYRTLRDTIAQAAKRPIERIRHPGAATHTSDEFWALRNIDLEVRHGEALGVIGKNGAGKSTLLKLLSRITEPTEGRVEVRGRVASLLDVGTGFHPELTGRENIQLNGAILGMKRTEIKSKFDEIVEFSEISRFLDTPVKRYSSGMYVRLAFAVAAHLEPEILVIDEVLAVGDAQFQKKCLGKMGDVAGQGRTVLFVSHNMAAVQKLCSTGLLLEHGRAAFTGTASTVVMRYQQMANQTELVALSTRVDRQGDGKLRFTSLGVLDGNANTGLVLGSPGSLALQYEGTPPLDNVQVSIGLQSIWGEGAAYLSTEMVGHELTHLPSKGTLICHLGRVPFVPGTYTVNIHCTVNGILADWVIEAASIAVAEGDYFDTGEAPPRGYGAVIVPHTWGFEPD